MYTEELPDHDPTAEHEKLLEALRAVRELRATKRLSHTEGAAAVTIDGNGRIRALTIARGATRSVRAATLGDDIRDAINGARSEAARRSRRLVLIAANEGPAAVRAAFADPAAGR